MRFQQSAASALAATVAASRVAMIESYRVLPRDTGVSASLVEEELITGELPTELVLDSVLDLSSSVFKGQKEVKVGGKHYRCCSMEKGDVSILVHVEDVKKKGMAWWAKVSTALGGATGCTQLVGKGYHSWSYWRGNKCKVLESALPAELREAAWIPQNRVNSVMDLTTLFVDPRTRRKYKDTKLANGKSYRCCTRDAAHPGKIVDTTGPDTSGVFTSKCVHLAGDGYHSWNHWKGGSCLVDSTGVPKELLSHLGAIVSGTISVKPGGGKHHGGGGSQQNGNGGNHHGGGGGHGQGGSHDRNPAPTPAPEVVEPRCGSGNEVKIRVVTATTANPIPGMPVIVYKNEGNDWPKIAEEVTQSNGMATLCVPADITTIAVEPSSRDIMSYWRDFNLERQCRGGRCMLQCAVQEK